MLEKPKLVGTMVEPYPKVAEINLLLSQVLNLVGKLGVKSYVPLEI